MLQNTIFIAFFIYYYCTREEVHKTLKFLSKLFRFNNLTVQMDAKMSKPPSALSQQILLGTKLLCVLCATGFEVETEVNALTKMCNVCSESMMKKSDAEESDSESEVRSHFVHIHVRRCLIFML